jgi:hypothetical protein
LGWSDCSEIFALTSGEFSGWRIAASPADADDKYAGVLMWWNSETVEMTDVKVLTPHTELFSRSGTTIENHPTCVLDESCPSNPEIITNDSFKLKAKSPSHTR